MFETGMSALVLKICSEYAKALGLNFPPCVQQEINAIAQYVDLHTVKNLKVEQGGRVVTITCFTEGEQEKVFTITLPEVNVDTLSALIKGSSSVVVDKSEDGKTLVVRLDKSQEVQYVELTPSSATQGTLTVTQWNILHDNMENCILLNNEIYRLADVQNVSGLLTYVHTGWDGTARKDKSISITVSTKAWTLVVAESGGAKLYMHKVIFEETPSSGAPIQYGGAHIEFMFLSPSPAEFSFENFFKKEEYPDPKSPYFNIICYMGNDEGIFKYGYNWTIYSAESQIYAIFFYKLDTTNNVLISDGSPTQITIGGSQNVIDTVTEL